MSAGGRKLGPLLTDLLDTRLGAASGWPVVAIPLLELPQRAGELPPPGAALRLIGEGEAWLRERGYRVEPAAETVGDPRLPARLWQPHPWLEEVAPEGPGVAWDLGCGSGREAVWLAARGWTVRAVDRLPDAIELARGRERAYGTAPRVEWTVGDLASLEGQADLIWIGYAPWRRMADRLRSWLRPGGVALIAAFTPEHAARRGRPRDRAMIADLEDADRLGAAYEVRSYGDREAALLTLRA